MTDMVIGISKDRVLKVAYFGGIPSIVVSVIAAVGSQHPVVLGSAVATIFVIGWPVAFHVFNAEPADLSTTYFPQKHLFKIIRRRCTYFEFYDILLVMLNMFLIAVIAAALPASTAHGHS